MNVDQEHMLFNIHEIALNDDHLIVPYSHDQLKMANAVIVKMQAKLCQIAELIKIVLGD